jgi:hypothetical protein
MSDFCDYDSSVNDTADYPEYPYNQTRDDSDFDPDHDDRDRDYGHYPPYGDFEKFAPDESDFWNEF